MPLPGDFTIGNWTEGDLLKVLRTQIPFLLPTHLAQLVVDDLRINNKIYVGDQIEFDHYDTFYVVGASGQPAFTNSWVVAGSPYYSAAFAKDAEGFTHLRGAIKNGTVGQAAFTLPPGYRPGATVRVPVVSNGAFGIVDITSGGAVIPQSPSSTLLVGLDNIIFKTA